MTDDEKILALFHKDMEEAIFLLRRKYEAQLLNIAVRILGNKEDAEECVNDVYVAIWKSGSSKQIPADKLHAYLIRTTRNLALKTVEFNHAKKRNSSCTLALADFEEQIAGGHSPEETIMVEELTNLLNQFLSNIKKESRILFVRRFWFGDTYTELAELSGQTEGKIRVHISRTIKKLKKFLIANGYSF